ncbi:hypothetical protein TrVGV298_004565 [Trichoderma virens]|nr:hypothetical protein TrVGV298_004565 [Trichoderma virens]
MAISSAMATLSPNIPGMKVVWQESFVGEQGDMVDLTQWNVMTDLHNNQELETYTQSSSNMQLSGGQTLQLGMWPAFWMLGDSMRHGTPWPLCGELDIFEQINGQLTGYGTAHCDHTGGGACNEPWGLGQSIAIPQDDEFHTWALKINRCSNNWQTETIEWYLDGNLFHTLVGAQFGDEGLWATLAHSPMYIILNLAVGGTWPGDPNEATLSGWGNMFEVQYVAVYESA